MDTFCRYVCTIILMAMGNLPGSTGQKSATPDGPGSYQMLNGRTDHIVIPFIMHHGKPLLDVEINGEKGTLMIDNGVLWDQVWLFGSPLVKQLNIEHIDEGSIGGAGEGETTAAYTAENITVKFDDIVFYEQPVLVSLASAGFCNMFPGVDGQLCNTFFKHFIVEFDFIKNHVILHRPEQFTYSGNGCVLDLFQNQSGTHSVPFRFEMHDGTSYDGMVDVDFGGVYPLKIALNNQHNIQLPENAKKTYSVGAQGKNTEYTAEIKSMAFGKYDFHDLIAVFGDEKTSYIHPDNLGVIGLPLFMKFDIMFDYINKKIYLDPNENFNKPFDD